VCLSADKLRGVCGVCDTPAELLLCGSALTWRRGGPVPACALALALAGVVKKIYTHLHLTQSLPRYLEVNRQKQYIFCS